MAFPHRAPYFRGSENDLIDLLELIADERPLSILRAVSGQEPLFRGTQFFFEQPEDE